jgi:hypothetical protein
MTDDETPKQHASVTDSAGSTTWKCVEFVSEGPFDDGEIMWHFDVILVETGEHYLVSVSGPGRSNGANFGRAMVGTAGIIAAAIGASMPGVAVDKLSIN